MNFLNRLSISQKIYLIPIIGAISFLVYLSLVIIGAKESIATLEHAKDSQFPVVQLSKSAAVDIVRVSELLNSAVTTGDEESIANADELAKEIAKTINKIGTISPSYRSEQVKMSKEFDEYFKQARVLSLGMVEGNIDFAKLPEMGKSMNDAFEKVKGSVEKFNQEQVGKFEKDIAAAVDDSETITSIGFIMCIITIALLFGTAVPIISGIKSSISDVVTSLKDISEGDGDLTVRLTSKSQDEIGELVASFNVFIEKLQTTITKVVNIALPLSDMANSVSQNAEKTNTITLSQQEEAQNTKLAVDNLNHNVQSVAENAALAAEAAVQTSNVSVQGETVVKETVETIHQLARTVEESAEVIDHLDNDANQIGVILDVIKGIAEQTNLLALNAAIEAARAGEQGRGFAVVADEVRTLASRTQDSTIEIQSTIEKLQVAARKAVSAMSNGRELADNSVTQVSKAGESLVEITSSVEQINTMTGDIARSTESQSEAATQIVHHVDEISRSSGQTHQASEDLASVSGELADLANDLEVLAKAFKV